MANFTDNVVTKAGGELMAEVIAKNAVFTPTRIAMGAGEVGDGVILESLTELVDKKNESPINKKKKLPDGSNALIGGAFSNKDVNEGYYFRELGMYAKAVYPDKTEGNEILYCYSNAGDEADYIPKFSTSTVVERQIDIIIYIGQEANVNLEVQSNVYVSVEDYEIQKGKVEENAEKINEIANRMKMKTVKLDSNDWSGTYSINNTTMCLTMDNILFVEIGNFRLKNLAVKEDVTVTLKTSGLNKIKDAFGGIPIVNSLSNVAIKETYVCTGVDMNTNVGTNPPSLVQNSLVLYDGSVQFVSQNVSSGTATNVASIDPFKGCCIIDGLKA